MSNSVNTVLNILSNKDSKHRDIEKNITVLQQQLQSKDKLVKSLMETQTMILETISKQSQTEESNDTTEHVPQYELYSESHEEAHNADLPY